MSAAREKAEAVLDRVAKADGVRGALIATRDGLPALSRLSPPADADTLAAMAAAALAALETASLELGGGGIATLLADGPSAHIAAAGLDDRHLLVLLLADGGAHAALEGARKELQAVLAE